MKVYGARQALEMFRFRHQGELEISFKMMSSISGDEGRAGKARIPEAGAGGKAGALLGVESAPGDHQDLLCRQRAGLGEAIHFPAEALDASLQGGDGFFILHDFIRKHFHQDPSVRCMVKFRQRRAGKLQISKRE